MSRSRFVAWFLSTVWILVATACEARLAAALGVFAPAFGLMVVLGLAARLPTGKAHGLVCAATLARAALATEPVTATLAYFLGALLFLRVVRSAFDVTSPAVLALATALAVFGAETWSALVRESRLVQGVALADGALLHAAATAVSTGVVMLLLGPAIAYLPGVTPLTRSSPWAAGASVR
ncbi:MAG: hypothetical protein L6Q99_20285 [Planctomycetes bacterium]|nr:hypothetical protein [Planctomycetota bacterium]